MLDEYKDNLVSSVIPECSINDSRHMLVSYFINHCFFTPDEIESLCVDNSNIIFEWLAYYTIPYFGINHNIINKDNFARLINNINTLLQHRQFEILSMKHISEEIDEIINYARWRWELTRSHSFDYQLDQLIRDIFSKFENQFKSSLGIGPIKSLSIVNIIYNFTTYAMNQYLRLKERFSEDEMFDIAQFSLDMLKTLGMKITKKEYNSFISLFGLDSKRIKSFTSPAEIRDWPVIVFPDNRILIGFHDHLLRIIFEKYNTYGISNHNVHKNEYNKHRSDWLEDKVCEYLKRIFPETSVFKKLKYPNPDRKDGSNAEIDLVVIWEPFLLLIECKSGSYDSRSFLGDSIRLKEDIGKILEDAFKQSKRALRYISSEGSAKFTEEKTGRQFALDINNYENVYHIIVSISDEIGLTTKLAAISSLGLFSTGEFPFAICITDLDLITASCIFPDVFLHFTEKVMTLLTNKKLSCMTLLDLFSFYLINRLSNLKDIINDDKYDHVVLDSATNVFQKDSYYRKGLQINKPELNIRLPNIIDLLLVELRGRNAPDARYIAFSLLELSDEILFDIDKLVKEIKESKIPEHVIRYTVFDDKNIVIVILCATAVNNENLRNRSEKRVRIEKYRRKCNKALAISLVFQEDDIIINDIIYDQKQWKYNVIMESEIENEPIKILAPFERLPGRNKRCICGSGKKFKNCCWNKYHR